MKTNKMNILKIFISVFLVFLTNSFVNIEAENLSLKKKQKLTFAVLSDVHVMAPNLLKNDGAAFEKYLSEDRKLLKESPALMEEAVSEIIKQHPTFVLICGDLTKDGEADSHYFLVNTFLHRFKEAGIKVYVVPGNHDINNPHAVSFDKDTTYRVHSLSDKEFVKCYADYGFRDAIARDTESLSYATQLNDSLLLIAIDDCRYQDNDFENNICVTGGRLKPATLKFIKKQSKIAHDKGMRVISMMHHGLVQHWKWQDKVMPEYLVDQWKKRVRFFSRNNVNIIFTGHFHSQDISKKKDVYDIETGSTVTYPCPYRIVTINNQVMNIRTHLLNNIDYNIQKDESVQQYAKDFVSDEFPNNIEKIFPKSIVGSIRKRAAEDITKAYVSNLAGDEHISNEDMKVFKSTYKDLRKSSKKWAFIFKHVTNNLSNDQAPQDNNFEIPFK